MAYCNGVYVGGIKVGQTCPDGSIATDIKQKTEGGGQSTVTGDVSKVPWNADKSRVLFGREPGRPLLGPGAGTVPTSISVYDITRKDSKGWLTNLKANNPDGYDNMVSLLRSGGFLGARANSPDSIRRAVDSVAKEAAARYESGQTENVDFLDYLYSRVGSGSGGSGSGGYSGPVTTTSITMTDENTAEALLNKFARDLLGRGLTEQETQKYIKQFNRAEAAAPQVSVSSGSGATRSSTTTTAASKEELLREVVSKNPDYAKFQIDTTVMDMLMDDIRKGQEVING